MLSIYKSQDKKAGGNVLLWPAASWGCVALISFFSMVSVLHAHAPPKSPTAISYTDIAKMPENGLNFRYAGLRNDALLNAFDVFPESVVRAVPMRLPPMFSAPGVAVLDFDNDGDLDIYVTNGNLERFGSAAPQASNGLYANQLSETGQLRFVDVTPFSGIAATDHDSTGVCVGDIDNDGDDDLLVTGAGNTSRLYENLANGQFEDISSRIQGDSVAMYSSSCSMGDLNDDGLLDFVVGNTCKGALLASTCTVSFEVPPPPDFVFIPGQRNQVFINNGNNIFVESGESLGVTAIGITWAIAVVDYDLDGDADIVSADDNAGYTRIHQNDGTGHFSDVTEALGLDRPGSWMGLAFGDLNSDGLMDIFSTNVGDYFFLGSGTGATLPPGHQFTPGDAASAWFLGQPGGGFYFPGSGSLGATPFGWGVSIADYDNDGDSDIIYHGGMSLGIWVDATNPGAILVNDGNAFFSRDSTALADSTDHARRTVRGMVTGDVNDDGFIDIISVSSKDWPASFPLAPILPNLSGGVFDDSAHVWPLFNRVDPGDSQQGLLWNGFDPVDGTLSVEISSAGNDNGWVKVDLMGSIGIVDHGRVNRSGIGAVVTFTPHGGESAMRPVMGGGSHASTDERGAVFGMGKRKVGVLDVLWPGGVRNRLYHVDARERIIFPEIPCSYDDDGLSFKAYKHCVADALKSLEEEGVIDHQFRKRLTASAIRARHKYGTSVHRKYGTPASH